MKIYHKEVQKIRIQNDSPVETAVQRFETMQKRTLQQWEQRFCKVHINIVDRISLIFSQMKFLSLFPGPTILLFTRNSFCIEKLDFYLVSAVILAASPLIAPVFLLALLLSRIFCDVQAPFSPQPLRTNKSARNVHNNARFWATIAKKGSNPTARISTNIPHLKTSEEVEDKHECI